MIFIATPLPTPPADFDLNSVTPTWVGFAATALVVIVTIALILDMVRRIRRMRYRAEIGERLAEEVAANDGAAGARPAPTGVTGNDSSAKGTAAKGTAAKGSAAKDSGSKKPSS